MPDLADLMNPYNLPPPVTIAEIRDIRGWPPGFYVFIGDEIVPHAGPCVSSAAAELTVSDEDRERGRRKIKALEMLFRAIGIPPEGEIRRARELLTAGKTGFGLTEADP